MQAPRRGEAIANRAGVAEARMQGWMEQVSRKLNDPNVGMAVSWTKQTISEKLDIPSNVDAASFGESVTLDATVTIGAGSTWTIGIIG